MDPVAITAAFTGAKHAAGLLKGAADTLKTLGKTEIIGDLIEAQLALMDLIEKQGELLDENRALQKEIEKLKERADFEIQGGFAFRKRTDGKYASEAYCPSCYVVMSIEGYLYTCTKCKYHLIPQNGLPEEIAKRLNSAKQ